MSAKLHTMMLKAMFMTLIIGAIVFVALAWINRDSDSALSPTCIAFAVFIFVGPMVWLTLPVRCPRAGCKGRMERKWIQAPYDQYNLQIVSSRPHPAA